MRTSKTTASSNSRRSKLLVPLAFLLAAGACTSGTDETEDALATETTADFESDRSAPADGLTDVDWVLALVETDGIALDPPADNRTSMTLNPDGSLEGGGGCNKFDGTWKTTNEDNIELSDLSIQEESCGDIQDWTEAIELLEKLDRWAIDDLTLVLTNDSNDKIIAVAS